MSGWSGKRINKEHESAGGDGPSTATALADDPARGRGFGTRVARGDRRKTGPTGQRPKA